MPANGENNQLPPGRSADRLGHQVRRTPAVVRLRTIPGVGARTAEVAAFVGDPKLTMAVYGRARPHDLGEAVRRLPSLASGPAAEAPALAATGTDGRLPSGEE